MKNRLILAFVILPLLLLMGCQQCCESSVISPTSATTIPTVYISTEDAIVTPFFRGDTWQEVYRQILLADSESYLAEADTDIDVKNRQIYLGIHDYDRDEVPELIIGYLCSAAVFTFRDQEAQKIADLYIPNLVWCINGFYARGDSISLQCCGSGGTNFVNFGYMEGAYILGFYTENCDDYDPPMVNEEPATLAQMDQIYPTGEDATWAKDRKWLVQLVQNKETWEIHMPSGEIALLGDSFDFQKFLWQ